MTPAPPTLAGAPRLLAPVSPTPARLGGGAGVVLPLVGVALWEVLARLNVVPTNWLPAPSAIAATIGHLAQSGALFGHLAATSGRVAAGFVVGTAAATLLALLTGVSASARALLDPTLQALRNIPSLAWIPLFLLWLGIDESSKVLLIALGAFFPVYLNLLQGILNLDVKLIEVGWVYGYRGARLVWHVLLPATLPAYVVGLRGGLSLAWMFVVAAELMGASRGLGFLMVDGQASSRADLIVASLLLFAVVGKLSDALLLALTRRFQPTTGNRVGLEVSR